MQHDSLFAGDPNAMGSYFRRLKFAKIACSLGPVLTFPMSSSRSTNSYTKIVIFKQFSMMNDQEMASKIIYLKMLSMQGTNFL